MAHRQQLASFNTKLLQLILYYVPIEQPALNLDYSKQPSWALGLLMYEVATGEHPFDGYPKNYNASSPPPLHMEPLAQMPEEFRSLVALLLSATADERPSLAEAQDILERL